MQECYHENVKTKTIVVDRRNAWFIDELCAVQKERDVLYKISKSAYNNSYWLGYKNIKKYYK